MKKTRTLSISNSPSFESHDMPGPSNSMGRLNEKFGSHDHTILESLGSLFPINSTLTNISFKRSDIIIKVIKSISFLFSLNMLDYHICYTFPSKISSKMSLVIKKYRNDKMNAYGGRI